MEDKTIYQKYDGLLEANTRLSEEVSSMKFTAEQIEYLERTLIMKDLRITCVGDDIFGDVLGDVKGIVWGQVEGREIT